MKLHLIAAHDESLVIGKDGALPWYLPDDLKHFKKITLGHPILMGRGVFEEIGLKPLPGRRNVVLTSQKWDFVETYPDISSALKGLSDEEIVFVIGGGQVYSQLLDSCEKLYITEVVGVHEGDVFFPEYRHQIGKIWHEIAREDHSTHRFVEYVKASV
jgi:dihydrofolate reductase